MGLYSGALLSEVFILLAENLAWMTQQKSQYASIFSYKRNKTRAVVKKIKELLLSALDKNMQIKTVWQQLCSDTETLLDQNI